MLPLILAVSLLAQTREAIEVRVTELEVAVLDRAGRPVEGLRAEDFEVRVGGRGTPVTNFFAVRNGAILDDDRAARPAMRVAAETSIPTSLVIFIDETRLHAGSRKRTLEALRRYVAANVGPSTTATLVRYHKHLDVRTRPTEKPGYILSELEQLSREPFLGDDTAREREALIEQIDEILFGAGRAGDIAGESPDTIWYRIEKHAEQRAAEVDRTLEALEGAIELASAFSGRKALLYVSEGLPQQPAIELFEYFDAAVRKAPNQVWRIDAARNDSARAMRFDRSAQFRRVAEAAHRGRVAIYSFDAGGVRGFEGTGAETAATEGRINTALMHSNLRGGLQFLADETGGRYITYENNVDKVLAQMSSQFATYYSLGIRASEEKGRGDIRVTVKNRPELRLMTSRRRPPRTRQETLEQSVRARLYTRETENPLAARIEVGDAALVAGECIATLSIGAGQPKLVSADALDMHFVMLNERNDESVVQRVALPFEAGRVSHTLRLRVQPQRHVLSVAVSNPLSGETSYVQAEVDGRACRR
ncbi:MAG TPA: VWA domain-containing protein [Thermoanaerobaculia bacterium]|nr:VWA domain-containing protein [Thermoanaerobaculia bacterium]